MKFCVVIFSSGCQRKHIEGHFGHQVTVQLYFNVSEGGMQRERHAFSDGRRYRLWSNLSVGDINAHAETI